MRCIPEQIIIGSSTHELVHDIVSLFDREQTVIAVEDPGFKKVFSDLESEGCTIKPIPMLPAPSFEDVAPYLAGTDLVFATPVSQFPTNRTTPAEIREQLVAWANATKTHIIDNEYCKEFEVGNPKPPALAALDTDGYIISLGTFSNSFAPSMCLSYAALPPVLVEKWKQHDNLAFSYVPWQTQAAMAEFMQKKYWLEHVRRTRRAILQKRKTMLEAIRTHLGDAFDVIEGENSLFVLLRARDGRSEQELIESARCVGARVHPTSQYWYTEPPEDWHYIMVGFAGIPLFKIESGIRTLAKAWNVRAKRSSRIERTAR